MSDVEQDEIFEEGIAENETIDEIPEPKKQPVKKKLLKIKNLCYQTSKILW